MCETKDVIKSEHNLLTHVSEKSPVRMTPPKPPKKRYLQEVRAYTFASLPANIKALPVSKQELNDSCSSVEDNKEESDTQPLNLTHKSPQTSQVLINDAEKLLDPYSPKKNVESNNNENKDQLNDSAKEDTVVFSMGYLIAKTVEAQIRGKSETIETGKKSKEFIIDSNKLPSNSNIDKKGDEFCKPSVIVNSSNTEIFVKDQKMIVENFNAKSKDLSIESEKNEVKPKLVGKRSKAGRCQNRK